MFNKQYGYIFLLLLSFTIFSCGETTTQSSEKENQTPAPSETEVIAPNTITEAEEKDGWKLLFDGKSTNGWRGYNKETFPTKGWKIDEEGNLTVSKSGTEEAGFGGDVVTVDQFENFELMVDFMVTDTGNSGILYRVLEVEDMAIWQNAPEFQVLDDQTYIDMGGMDMTTHLTGDNYDLHSSVGKYSNPVGEWNTAKIIVNGNQVEHWLNGKKTVEYEFLSPEWEALVAKSKFKDYPEYGRTKKGYIGLQDNGHLIKFRNIKIKEL